MAEGEVSDIERIIFQKTMILYFQNIDFYCIYIVEYILQYLISLYYDMV